LLQTESRAGNTEVSILLTDDARIRELNRQYRKIDRPTDVLSFSQTEEEDHPNTSNDVLGDIVISVETARRQALELGRDPDDEIDLLAAHGALHLLGYDDATAAGADEMRRRVASVLGAKIAG